MKSQPQVGRLSKPEDGHWVTLSDGRHIFIGGDAPPASGVKFAEGEGEYQKTWDEYYANRAQTLAEKEGYRGKVNVINEDPEKFKVGNQNFDYAGTFAGGKITVNQKVVDRTDLPAVIAHEVMHDKWAYINDQRSLERAAMLNLNVDDYKFFFTPNGSFRASQWPEFQRQFPVTALLAQTTGVGLPRGIPRKEENLAQMIKDDGVTDYSKAYWTPESLAQHGTDRAINETLAEITAARRNSYVHEQVSPLWWKLYNGINDIYAKR